MTAETDVVVETLEEAIAKLDELGSIACRDKCKRALNVAKLQSAVVSLLGRGASRRELGALIRSIEEANRDC